MVCCSAAGFQNRNRISFSSMAQDLLTRVQRLLTRNASPHQSSLLGTLLEYLLLLPRFTPTAPSKAHAQTLLCTSPRPPTHQDFMENGPARKRDSRASLFTADGRIQTRRFRLVGLAEIKIMDARLQRSTQLQYPDPSRTMNRLNRDGTGRLTWTCSPAIHNKKGMG